MSVTSRTQLKDYCLRALGAPLIQIDVSEDQIEDRIDEAINYFREYYFDGIEKNYYKHQITQTDMDNGYITIPDHIWSVNRVFQTVNTSSSSTNIFDVEYQLRMNDLRDLTSTSMIYYTQVMSHIALIENILHTQKQFRFNRLNGKLYIDQNWDAKMVVGQYLMLDAYAALDPATSPKMWDVRLFKEYVTALIKKQWGSILKKYSGIALPGGVTIDGKDLYDEAVNEIKDIEDEVMGSSAPLEFQLG